MVTIQKTNSMGRGTVDLPSKEDRSVYSLGYNEGTSTEGTCVIGFTPHKRSNEVN